MNTQTPSRFNLLSQLGFALLLCFPLAVGAAGVPPASGNTYWIANEGQWEGDFQFKCEVGSTVYYVTPKGMTVDFREFKRYPKPRDPRDPLDMMDRHEDHDSVTVRGHVVQIHYSGLPQNPSADLGGLRGASGSLYFVPQCFRLVKQGLRRTHSSRTPQITNWSIRWPRSDIS